jgi:hypothetical protein
MVVNPPSETSGSVWQTRQTWSVPTARPLRTATVSLVHVADALKGIQHGIAQHAHVLRHGL